MSWLIIPFAVAVVLFYLLLYWFMNKNVFEQNRLIKKHNYFIGRIKGMINRRKFVINKKCKGCNYAFGYDNTLDFDHPDEEIEYYLNRQPKWKVRIFNKTWYYCCDDCLSKDFEKCFNHYVFYKKMPTAKYKLRLTDVYKLKKEFRGS